MRLASLSAVIGTVTAQLCSNLQMSDVFQLASGSMSVGALFSINITAEEMAI